MTELTPTSTPDDLAMLPEAWHDDRMLLGDRRRAAPQAVFGDDHALLVAVHRADRDVLVGRGDPEGVGRLLAELVARPRVLARLGTVRWLSVPRGSTVSDTVLADLGLAPFSTWDWMSSDVVPPRSAGEDDVVRLDPTTDAPAIRRCLDHANPGTTAVPGAPGEIAWWGVPGLEGLLGVIGAAERAGDPAGADLSWHLHGLGVLPSARHRGLGGALAAAATREGLAAGIDWVGLGHYAENHTARRLYERLGFVTSARFASYGPSGATTPPAS
ncbi:GNAT family N-acetyltransferase [Actinotalea sp. K2]|uniref:GNAT family N-acetyltransferase n=1 Tax=Actinotalea sp. K2 TaxID=2939438 RepID=UPI002017B2C0|nr:GNAT family N-acetyltransferase [Actinotalea sp. K2]MCL3862863.1 GNAT family N-acetyltransferase [Actinotalea sp. K2]